MIGTVPDRQEFGSRQGRDRLVAGEQPGGAVRYDPRALATPLTVPGNRAFRTRPPGAVKTSAYSHMGMPPGWAEQYGQHKVLL
jgi:hypothetical protein